MYAREYRPTRSRKALVTLLSGLTLIWNAHAFAKPDMQPLGPNIADKGSAFYHFSVNSFDSADGSRHYRVWTAVPNKAAPASGYPILYMLDGNAVMDRLNDDLLKQLAEKSPPVIVAVGYQTNLPFDLNGRAYDYSAKGGTGIEYRSAASRPVGALLRRPVRAGCMAAFPLFPDVLQRQPVVGQRP